MATSTVMIKKHTKHCSNKFLYGPKIIFPQTFFYKTDRAPRSIVYSLNYENMIHICVIYTKLRTYLPLLALLQDQIPNCHFPRSLSLRACACVVCACICMIIFLRQVCRDRAEFHQLQPIM